MFRPLSSESFSWRANEWVSWIQQDNGLLTFSLNLTYHSNHRPTYLAEETNWIKSDSTRSKDLVSCSAKKEEPGFAGREEKMFPAQFKIWFVSASLEKLFPLHINHWRVFLPAGLHSSHISRREAFVSFALCLMLCDFRPLSQWETHEPLSAGCCATVGLWRCGDCVCRNVTFDSADWSRLLHNWTSALHSRSCVRASRSVGNVCVRRYHTSVSHHGPPTRENGCRTLRVGPREEFFCLQKVVWESFFLCVKSYSLMLLPSCWWIITGSSDHIEGWASF